MVIAIFYTAEISTTALIIAAIVICYTHFTKQAWD